MSKKAKVLFIEADRWACGEYRIIQPVRALQRVASPDDEISFHLYSDERQNDTTSVEFLDYVSDFDAVIIQRPAHPKMADLMREVKKIGKKVYTELDDALFNVHPSNPAHTVWNPKSPCWQTLKDVIELSDKLILSTEQLRDIYYQKESVVFENGIDNKLPAYSPENNRRHQLPNDKVIVGWAGSTSHLSSLKSLTKPIKKLCKERENVIFALCSNPEFMDFFDIPKNQKQYVKHKPIGEWPPVMSLFDINLAVVPNDIFNSGKSELKVLEAGIWGIPSVCTRVAPYVRFNKNSDGGNLLVTENDTNEWVRAIGKMIDDRELYRNMAEKTLNTVKTRYNLEEINKKRIEFFKSELL